MKKPMRVIISGGGTGGHIFPAVAIAQALLQKNPNCEILFVGAEGKMEMTKVPAAGFRIIGLPIVGLQRKLTIKNMLVPFKIIQSLLKARSVIREFRPDIAVGVGGYASGPLLRMASWMGIPTLIQEQNSYPGITNKLLAKKAAKICVAYKGLDQYFPANKIVITGNPVRSMVMHTDNKRTAALDHFQMDASKPVLLVIGGSLGARTINESMALSLDIFAGEELQIIWQTGSGYYPKAHTLAAKYPRIRVYEFIAEMDLAYAAASIIISRAGAMSISELCIIGKPCILVPSPNVAEDHQTKNAMALVQEGAALLVADKEAHHTLATQVVQLLSDQELQTRLSQQIQQLKHENAAGAIVNIIHQITSRG
jgi:UDP-N-acetylglucosamine--N-acetylmuramyl-(pentapeptide) pyrophosphoryl-undecaprenol N-acetylglucosamine transferase